MKATEKEKKCIDYSLRIRKNQVNQELNEQYSTQWPLLICPKGFVNHFWQDYSVTKKMLSPFKAMVYSAVFYLIYIIAFPFVFVLGLIDRIFTKNKEKRAELNNKYLIDYEVSELKSFETLWNTKGLRDWGAGYYHLQFTDEYKLECLKYWCEILYGIDGKNFNVMVTDLRNSIAISRLEFYAKYPNGHISMVSPLQLLSNEIQTRFGNYTP